MCSFPKSSEDDAGRCFGRHSVGIITVAVVGLSCLLGARTASAAEAATGMGELKSFTVGQIFTFLFLMLGPFKIIGPFLKITKGADAPLTRQIAFLATLYATLALLIAAFLGESILGKYGIPAPILALAAGIVLLVVALQTSVQQFATPTSHNDGTIPEVTETVNKSVALVPIAFPTIVTPYGIAALVFFLSLTQDLPSQLIIGAVVLVIMSMNFIVMLIARHIPLFLMVLLQILGAVLGIIQVALGLQIIYNSFKALAIL